MRKFQLASYILIISLFSTTIFAQEAADFTVTDTNGNERQLYADYLDKGKTVLIKFFFVACPPCNAVAPSVQGLYEDWGEGTGDVEFLEMTILGSDNDSKVNGYKTQHGLSFAGVSADGGALGAVQPFTSGDYGAWRGTPSFAVIDPSGDVNYGSFGAGTANKIANLDAAIAATGAQKPGTAVLPAIFNINVKDAFDNEIDNVELFLGDATDATLNYPLSSNTLSIISLSEQYPGINEPILKFQSTGRAIEKVSPLDLLLMRKHILSIIPITDPDMQIAADLDGSGTISPLDLLIMRKLILNIIQDFPVPSYRFVPEELPIDIINGETLEIDVKSIKIGDLNGI